jgi:hypothetical protein
MWYIRSRMDLANIEHQPEFTTSKGFGARLKGNKASNTVFRLPKW